MRGSWLTQETPSSYSGAGVWGRQQWGSVYAGRAEGPPRSGCLFRGLRWPEARKHACPAAPAEAQWGDRLWLLGNGVVTVPLSFCHLDVLGPRWCWRGCPSQSSLIPRDGEKLICKYAFQMPTNRSRAPVPENLLYQALTSQLLLACPQPQGRYQTTLAAPMCLQPTEMIQTRRSSTR